MAIEKSSNFLRNLIIVIVLVVIAFLIYMLYSKNIKTNMKMMDYSDQEQNSYSSENYQEPTDETTNSSSNSGNYQEEEMKEKFTQGGNTMDYYSMDSNFEEERNNSHFPKEQLSAEELLPKNNSSDLWAKVNPEGEGSLEGKNFLQSGYHIGINTVGQTLRNANMQLRSEPPNPQVKVSPWQQSTIEPDLGRKPLEIGGCN